MITVTLPKGADIEQWERDLRGKVWYGLHLENLSVFYAVVHEDQSYRAIEMDGRLEEHLTAEKLFDLLATAERKPPRHPGMRPVFEWIEGVVCTYADDEPHTHTTPTGPGRTLYLSHKEDEWQPRRARSAASQ